MGLYGGYGPGLNALGWTFAALNSILLGMRIYVWARIQRHGSWALVWAIVAWTGAMVETIVSTVGSAHGLGNHIAVIEEEGGLEVVSTTIFFIFLTAFFFTLNIILGKIQAASLILALHEDSHPKRRLLIHGVWIVVALAAAQNLFVVWFHCSPPSALWDPLRQQDCNIEPYVISSYVGAICSGIADLVLALLPIWLIWPLQMQLRLKVIVSFLMGLGVLAAVASFMVASLVGTFRDTDFPYDLAPLYFWGRASCWLVLIASNVPSVRPLVKSLAAKSLRRPSRQSNQNTFVQLEEGRKGSKPDAAGEQISFFKHVEIESHVERSDSGHGSGRRYDAHGLEDI